MILFLHVQKVKKREIWIVFGVLGHAKPDKDLFNVVSGLHPRISKLFRTTLDLGWYLVDLASLYLIVVTLISAFIVYN